MMQANPPGEGDKPRLPMAADLFGDIEPTPRASWRDYAPGLIVAGAGTAAAGFIADHYHAPLTLMALLIGLALNFLSADARLHAGLGFASRALLRWGIVLIGVRVTFAQIVALGPAALLCVVLTVAAVIGSGVLAARRFGFSSAFGVLAGGAVAICGASAALAIATTLGERRINQGQLTLVLVGISAMSALALVLYPSLAQLMMLSDVKAGYMLGASIHDVAQTLGAGYAYSPGAGQNAAIVKLTRVALLAPVLGVIALFFKGEGSGPKAGVPWFVIGFFLLAGVNSLVSLPVMATRGAEALAAAMLATAVTATAIRSPMRQLMEGGARPLYVIASATLVALALATGAAVWLVG